MSGSARSGGRRATACFAAGGVFAASAAIGLLPSIAGASSHREAPLIANDPAVDNTDVYAFSSPENPNNVTFIANWLPFEEPNGGPNFYPWAEDAEYLINIDNDGDAVPDLIYRWRFTTTDLRGTDTFLYNNGPVTSLYDENLLFRQHFTLDVSTDAGYTYGKPIARGPVAPSYVGPASMGSAEDYVENLRDPAITKLKSHAGGRTLATQTEDPFFLDLRVFDLLYGGDLSERGNDTLAGYNVNSIVLEVPKSAVAIDGNAKKNPVIGVWSTTTRPTLRNADGTAAGSGYTQVSRLGNPLVNEVVVPAGLKDAFNAIPPSADAEAADGAVVDRVLNPEVPRLIEAIYGVPAPKTPRFDLFEVFLTGIVTNAKVDVDGKRKTKNPIDIDLNSQAINAGADPSEFQPSEMLRLNMSITRPTGLDGKPLEKASRLGVIGGDIQGFPNGRRLADDVVDIELLALEGIYNVNNVPKDRRGAFDALKEGDKVPHNDAEFSNSFPYLAPPETDSVNVSDDSRGNEGAAVAAAGGNGLTGTLLPAITGSVAALLIGAGGVSLMRSRTSSARAAVGAEV